MLLFLVYKKKNLSEKLSNERGKYILLKTLKIWKISSMSKSFLSKIPFLCSRESMKKIFQNQNSGYFIPKKR